MSSALLVPIPEAEPATARWWPLWQPEKAKGIPAHVTVLFPFLRRADLDAAARDAIAEVAAGVAPFDVSFSEIGRFPATVYLAPDPAAPFAELTRLVVARFPDHPPYRGTHGSQSVPHLTVLTCPDADLLRQAEREIAGALPVHSRVEELWLTVEQEHGGWQLDRVFPLG